MVVRPIVKRGRVACSGQSAGAVYLDTMIARDYASVFGHALLSVPPQLSVYVGVVKITRTIPQVIKLQLGVKCPQRVTALHIVNTVVRRSLVVPWG